jgi:hypothetical protein
VTDDRTRRIAVLTAAAKAKSEQKAKAADHGMTPEETSGYLRHHTRLAPATSMAPRPRPFCGPGTRHGRRAEHGYPRAQRAARR